MSESKHTPGPWRISRIAETMVESGERGICSTGGYQQNFDTDRIYSENRANACLISAAPEMYFILKELADAFPSAEYLLSQGQEDTPVLKRIRAAIAKAEGRS